MPRKGAILDITRGHFRSGFAGCVQNVFVQNVEMLSSSASADLLERSGITGRNVDSCDEQSPIDETNAT